ncbi:glucose PTS transporter subunit IIA [Clostridium neonatale]|uniref:PTS system, glucose/maltose-family IIABC component n=1 Tax=Clostridium neonatale TaxID=137838 RepID=A0AA86JMY2_9CLOT|nr:glucose PTS transporter subunit IIA [Clostridium neonatale]MBP8312787.1 PTS glucose transporter subunit IIA [Clostridium neonatale]CAG9709880.1 PTS system, glucose/maltose-family IIABC component [Clostridium neonatale]CAI3584165.1 PTS system, glucose/maltose-family IIABC component [Clostridium neonatale]CAI3593429.1 PTS system, glucose/maltose-family IIABC component [Clostridium neonatale]CAI3627385.1 PTS system, glucose/maltose-family IIABC component [Clostridium neonatale]
MSVKSEMIMAPVSGKCVDIKEVPDKMFAEKIMGEGVAFRYDGDVIYSPCNGTIAVIAETKHAIGIKSENGVELLIHVGVETVSLKGDGFEALVQQDEKVEIGTPILKIDRKFMSDKNIDLITPMVITNGEEFDLDFFNINSLVKKGESQIAVCKVRRQVEDNKRNEGNNMRYEKLCKDIIKNVGGKENVISVMHCITRLRFSLKNEGQANTNVLKNMDGVMDVIKANGQYQVVIGTHVEDVYNDLIKIGNFTSESDTKKESIGHKKGVISAFLKLISEIFQPVLGAMTAAGMIKGVLALLTITNVLNKEDGTYILLSVVGDSLFYFLPIILGYTAAKRFKVKEVIGMTLGGVLVYPTVVSLMSGKELYSLFSGTMFESHVYTTFLGIPVILQSYASTVIPVILIVYVASHIQKLLDKVLPSMIRSFFVPFLTLLIAAPLGLLVIGPVAGLLQNMLGAAVTGLIALNAGIAGLFLGAFWTILVMFGLHWGVIPFFAIDVATYGYDVINPLIFSGALASMGSVLAVIIRTKSSKERNIAIPAFLSTIFGINEPALYGVLIPRKKIFISTLVASGIGGEISGFAGSKLYAFGASGILGLPCFINPNGIDAGFIGLIISGVASFVLAFVAAFIIGDKKEA